MALTTNAAPAYAAINFDAFDAQTELNQSRRLANRKAMMEMETAMAAKGQKINSVEDYMTLAQNTLGAGSFINSGSPTVDAVKMILEGQNKEAAAAQEKSRRDQFKVDADERKTVEQTIKERFANGDDAISVLEQAQKLYGQEAVQKLQPDFKRMQSDAEREAVTKGLQYGRDMFEDTDDFNTFKTSNPYVPKHELVGMEQAAKTKELKRTADIEAMASNIGATGPVTAEAAEFEIRAKILPLFGQNARADKVEKAVKSAVSIALAASQRQSIAAKQKITDAGQLNSINNFTTDQNRIYELEANDAKQRELLAAQRMAAGRSVKDNQVAVVENVFKGKKTLSASEMGIKAELMSTMGSNVFTGSDAALYTDAVMRGDKREIAKIRARAVPADQYNEQVESTSRILTGVHKFRDINEATSTLTRLGMSSLDIAKIGQEYAKSSAVVAKAPPSTGTPKRGGLDLSPVAKDGQPQFVGKGLNLSGRYDNRATNGWSGTGQPGAPVSMADEATSTAQLTMDSLLNGFKANVVDFIGDATDALAQNGSVSASQDELGMMARRMAQERATAFVSGMGLKPDDAANKVKQITDDILNATPARAPISKKVSQADAYRNSLQQRDEMLRVQSGGIPGAAQRYPAAGQGVWSAADF